ncbi:MULTISPECIES: hypothetical protein [Pseudanabaena]|uniref:Uncharacterized protein n=2 Tax=Pseudanabaena TaxID=1152 RepID=L8N6E0_9CYAN|nr:MULTISPECIES: hypothetical protein [Pseudanabaena]ELS33783.1 hypothetical protein Pse7429DRAFT_1018 [Pseudanabaena biceps PCC 7429]MDG3494005.1 hypothetical protein [Pseudanabaena catenata USMAC16]
MQVTEKPVSTEQTEQVDALVIEQVIEQVSEPSHDSALLSINAQVSFANLLTLIQTLPKEQKWQIYQALGAELSPQSAEAKAIARLADEDDESMWITVVHEDDEIDEEALNEWLVKRGYKKAEV